MADQYVIKVFEKGVINSLMMEDEDVWFYDSIEDAQKTVNTFSVIYPTISYTIHKLVPIDA